MAEAPKIVLEVVKINFDVLNLNLDSVIVAEVDGAITLENAALLKESLEAVWPANRVVVLFGGIKLKIVEPSVTGLAEASDSTAFVKGEEKL